MVQYMHIMLDMSSVEEKLVGKIMKLNYSCLLKALASILGDESKR